MRLNIALKKSGARAPNRINARKTPKICGTGGRKPGTNIPDGRKFTLIGLAHCGPESRAEGRKRACLYCGGDRLDRKRGLLEPMLPGCDVSALKRVVGQIG